MSLETQTTGQGKDERASETQDNSRYISENGKTLAQINNEFGLGNPAKNNGNHDFNPLCSHYQDCPGYNPIDPGCNKQTKWFKLHGADSCYNQLTKT